MNAANPHAWAKLRMDQHTIAPVFTEPGLDGIGNTLRGVVYSRHRAVAHVLNIGGDRERHGAIMGIAIADGDTCGCRGVGANDLMVHFGQHHDHVRQIFRNAIFLFRQGFGREILGVMPARIVSRDTGIAGAECQTGMFNLGGHLFD